jgi:uncharacterized protein (TIGR02679 family)
MASAQRSDGAPLPQPVPRWLANPALTRLWEAARARLEHNHLVPAGRIVITGLQRAERHAIGGLLARPIVIDRVTVDLADLDEVITNRSPYRGLAAAVTAVTGRPLHDRKAERSAAVAARERPLTLARELLAGDPVFEGATWGEAWLAAIRRSGSLTRAEDPARAVCHALALLAEILPPGAAGTSRTELAARVTGSAHGLDDGTVVAQLTLRALALAADAEPPASAAARRDLWERYGVSADSVSSTCLALGLLAHGDEPVARRLRLAAEAGDPVHITARDLRGLQLACHRSVLVCENPRVLEAIAGRFGGAIPVVCTVGQPRLVVLDLLRRLASAGAMLRYHGDFDWPGIAIANRLIAEAGVAPWRMGASDYQAAVQRTGAILELSGPPVTPSWDPALDAAMKGLGIAVHEEAVLGELLACLPLPPPTLASDRG